MNVFERKLWKSMVRLFRETFCKSDTLYTHDCLHVKQTRGILFSGIYTSTCLHVKYKRKCFRLL